MRRILVTGGSGFIGTNLVDLYRRAEATEVVNYDLRAPRCPAHTDSWAQGDVTASVTLLAVMADFRPTHLVHLAARTDLAGRDMQGYRSNTEGVRAVLDCLRSFGSLQRAVFASSRLVCDLGEAPTSDYDYYPPNYYGRSKVVGEQLVRAHGSGSQWVIVRPTSIWGPWGETPYREFFLSLARGTYLHPGHERVLKHYGYVGNTVFQLDRLLMAPADRVHGRTFYLADPEPTEVGSFAAMIRRALGRAGPPSAPVPLLHLVAWAGDALKATGLLEPPLTSARLRHLRTPMLFDLEEVSELVGRLPFTVDEGVERTIAYLRDQGDIPRRVSADRG